MSMRLDNVTTTLKTYCYICIIIYCSLQLEEDKILSSGRTKIPGLRTRMELAWQKEREDQQRILQETSTLARDLRQTLFEVERERDKERLESKRRQEQMKRASEEEMEENRKKITEVITFYDIKYIQLISSYFYSMFN